MGLTALSWAAAVAASAVALFVGSRDKLAWPRLWTAALVVGAGFAAMHFVGVAALGMAPAIAWDWQVVIGTVVIAICASATALEAFFLVRSTRRGQRLPARQRGRDGRTGRRDALRGHRGGALRGRVAVPQ